VTGNGGTYTGVDGLPKTGSGIGSQCVSKDLDVGGNGNIGILYDGPDVAQTCVITPTQFPDAAG
jgi:hypothetical protein